MKCLMGDLQVRWSTVAYFAWCYIQAAYAWEDAWGSLPSHFDRTPEWPDGSNAPSGPFIEKTS